MAHHVSRFGPCGYSMHTDKYQGCLKYKLVSIWVNYNIKAWGRGRHFCARGLSKSGMTISGTLHRPFIVLHDLKPSGFSANAMSTLYFKENFVQLTEPIQQGTATPVHDDSRIVAQATKQSSSHRVISQAAHSNY